MAAQVLPGLALLGAGIFVKDQYVSALRNVVDVVELKYVWSRSAVRCFLASMLTLLFQSQPGEGKN